MGFFKRKKTGPHLSFETNTKPASEDFSRREGAVLFEVFNYF